MERGSFRLRAGSKSRFLQKEKAVFPDNPILKHTVY